MKQCCQFLHKCYFNESSDQSFLLHHTLLLTKLPWHPCGSQAWISLPKVCFSYLQGRKERKAGNSEITCICDNQTNWLLKIF